MSDYASAYPVEVFSSLDMSGVPSHKLELKVSLPAIVIRNLDALRLCNVTELRRHIVQVTILTHET